MTAAFRRIWLRSVAEWRGAIRSRRAPESFPAAIVNRKTAVSARKPVSPPQYAITTPSAQARTSPHGVRALRQSASADSAEARRRAHNIF